MLPSPEQVEVADYAPISRGTGALHRVFDVVCAVIGLVLLSPFFLLIAVAIKLDDGGPVFYRQSRVGKRFHNFRLFKFRSMAVNADRAGSLTAPGDPRLTRTGRWLRRYKFDELPQLFNVVTGDMQLVGARPEVEPYVTMFRHQYAEILLQRPGITDPATLAYRHEDQCFNTTEIEKQYVEEILPSKLRLSLAYQQRRTFWSDLKIIFQTVFGLAS
jgi:lipopolysaccharide/colanic/teichoic acid biosynthesis glycosyltransferase